MVVKGSGRDNSVMQLTSVARFVEARVMRGLVVRDPAVKDSVARTVKPWSQRLNHERL